MMLKFLPVPMLAVLIATGLMASTSAETKTKEFIIPANDGYGMDECMAEGGSCAKLIADSWCQVNGMTTSIRFVPAEASDVTASISRPNDAAKAPSPGYIVTCGN